MVSITHCPQKMGGIPTTFCLIISLRSPLALLLYLHPEVYYKATGTCIVASQGYYYEIERHNSNLIVGTMSGKVFYLDSKSGEEIWSFETGSPLFRSSHHPIIPSINGSIYLYSEHGLKVCILSPSLSQPNNSADMCRDIRCLSGI